MDKNGELMKAKNAANSGLNYGTSVIAQNLVQCMLSAYSQNPVLINNSPIIDHISKKKLWKRSQKRDNENKEANNEKESDINEDKWVQYFADNFKHPEKSKNRNSTQLDSVVAKESNSFVVSSSEVAFRCKKLKKILKKELTTCVSCIFYMAVIYYLNIYPLSTRL